MNKVKFTPELEKATGEIEYNIWILPVKGEAIWSKGKQSNETVQTE